MMHARNFAVVVVAIGVLVFAAGSMEASAQTSPGTSSSVGVQQPPSGSAAPSIPEYLLVIPGPNPTTRESTVTVYTVPTV